MGRPKGSKNKVKTAPVAAGVIDLDKHNNITRDGKTVGVCHYVNDMFVAYVGKVEFRNFDLDLLLEDVKNTIEF